MNATVIKYLCECREHHATSESTIGATGVSCQETRTPVTFFLIFLTMDAPPFPYLLLRSPLCTA